RLTRAAAQPAQQPALLAAGSLALSLALCAHRPLGRGLETGGGRLAGLSRPAGWTVRGLAAGPLAHLRVAGGALRAAAVLRLLRREDGRPAVVARRAALRLLRRVRHGRRAVVVVVRGGRLLRLPVGDAPPAPLVPDRPPAAGRPGPPAGPPCGCCGGYGMAAVRSLSLSGEVGFSACPKGTPRPPGSSTIVCSPPPGGPWGPRGPWGPWGLGGRRISDVRTSSSAGWSSRVRISCGGGPCACPWTGVTDWPAPGAGAWAGAWEPSR